MGTGQARWGQERGSRGLGVQARRKAALGKLLVPGLWLAALVSAAAQSGSGQTPGTGRAQGGHREAGSWEGRAALHKGQDNTRCTQRSGG